MSKIVKRLFTPSNVKDRPAVVSRHVRIDEEAPVVIPPQPMVPVIPVVPVEQQQPQQQQPPVQAESTPAAVAAAAAAVVAQPATETTPINTANNDKIQRRNYKAIVFNTAVFLIVMVMMALLIFLIYNYVKITRENASL